MRFTSSSPTAIRRPSGAHRAWLGAGLVALAAVGCHSPERRAQRRGPAPIDSMELGHVQSCFQCGDVYLGSLPNSDDVELASRRGVRTLIDVTPPGFEPDFSIAKAARDFGLAYVRIPVEPSGADDLQVDAALAQLSNPERGLSFLFGVTSGTPALLMGIYRSHHGGVELEQAIEDALRVGMEPGASEDTFRRQIERLATAEDGGLAGGEDGSPADASELVGSIPSVD